VHVALPAIPMIRKFLLSFRSSAIAKRRRSMFRKCVRFRCFDFALRVELFHEPSHFDCESDGDVIMCSSEDAGTYRYQGTKKASVYYVTSVVRNPGNIRLAVAGRCSAVEYRGRTSPRNRKLSCRYRSRGHRYQTRSIASTKLLP
jgi:hypothetical protein